MTQRDEINLRGSLRTIRVQPAKDVHFEEKKKRKKERTHLWTQSNPRNRRRGRGKKVTGRPSAYSRRKQENL